MIKEKRVYPTSLLTILMSSDVFIFYYWSQEEWWEFISELWSVCLEGLSIRAKQDILLPPQSSLVPTVHKTLTSFFETGINLL